MEQQKTRAFQDYYPENLSYCYGCGRMNAGGLHIKSYWDGDETVAYFTPDPIHSAVPGYVYGGLLASLIDCHGTGSASAAAYRHENRNMDSLPALRFLTASLHVDFLKPTPLGIELEIRGRIKEIDGRRVTVDEWILAGDAVTVRGEVVAVQVPAKLARALGIED